MRLGRSGEAFFVEPVESETESEEDEEGTASSEARLRPKPAPDTRKAWKSPCNAAWASARVAAKKGHY